MRNWLYAAAVLEGSLLAALVILFRGGGGATAAVAVLTGLLFMAALAVPSLAVIVLSGRWSQTACLAALAAVSFGKMVGVAGGVVYVWQRAPLPRMEFVLGMMVGWVASFITLAIVARNTMGKRTRA